MQEKANKQYRRMEEVCDEARRELAGSGARLRDELDQARATARACELQVRLLLVSWNTAVFYDPRYEKKKKSTNSCRKT